MYLFMKTFSPPSFIILAIFSPAGVSSRYRNVPPMSCEGNLGLPPSVTSSETDQSPAKPKKSKKKKAKDDCASGGSVAVSEGTTCINSGTLSTENSER